MRNNVREFRKAMGMTMTELSHRVGFSTSHVSLIEKNERRLNQDTIKIFCKVLNCTHNELFGIKGVEDDNAKINPDLHQRLFDAISKLSPDRQLEEIEVLELRVSRK